MRHTQSLLCRAHDETHTMSTVQSTWWDAHDVYYAEHMMRHKVREVSSILSPTHLDGQGGWYTHWSSIHILVTVWHRHHQYPLSPPLSFEPRWGGGNRGKHSVQNRHLMIQGRSCLKGHIWKAISKCISRQMYHKECFALCGNKKYSCISFVCYL